MNDKNWIPDWTKLIFCQDFDEVRIDEAMKLKSQYIPNRLFKYRSINKFSLENLTNDTVWVDTPKNFNDPFDCAFNIQGSYALQELKIPIILEKMQTDNKIKFSFDEIERLKNMSYVDFMTHVLNKDEEIRNKGIAYEIAKCLKEAIVEIDDEHIKTLSNNAQSSIYVCCFSEVMDSILMWSHYADNHKGFCMEYDFANLPVTELLNRILMPVIYSENMFDIYPYFQIKEGKKNNNLMMDYAAIWKCKEWEYEQEWRLAIPLGLNNKGWNMRVPTPKAVYLGALITDDNRDIILKICISKGITCYQMKLDNHYFRLNANVISK
jgi:hypothetical protein